MEKVRLNKYLASVGVASRRGIDQLIAEGRVKVNNKIAVLGDKVNPEKDAILVDGEQIGIKEGLVYIVLNKPKGIISTANDEFGRKSVVDLVKSAVRLYPVGRLDENSTGLILLTNDGDLAYKLTHPKFQIPKTYEVIIQGIVEDKTLERLRTGIRLKEGLAKAEVKKIKEWDNRSLLEMIIHQGWYHQIRRMFASIDLELISLKRLTIGSIQLGSLPEGKSRELTPDELSSLKNDYSK